LERWVQAGDVKDRVAGVMAAREHGGDDPMEATARDAVGVLRGRGGRLSL